MGLNNLSQTPKEEPGAHGSGFVILCQRVLLSTGKMLSCLFFFMGGFGEIHNQAGGYKDCGISSRDYANAHCHGEIIQDLSTKEVQGQSRDEGRS